MSTRRVIRGITLCSIMLGLSGCLTCPHKRTSSLPTISNDRFYVNGTFDAEAAKDAYIQLMKHYGYPVFDDARAKLWVSDAGTGEFTSVGFGAIIFLNHEGDHVGDRYMLLDIFLLPNQMLPEHYHLATDKCGPKMEGWLCRHGRSYVYGEGPKTENLHAKIPELESKWVTVFHETVIDPGQSAHLNRPTARHWQFAGPEGAILTEVGTFHDNAGVRHTDPRIVF